MAPLAIPFWCDDNQYTGSVETPFAGIKVGKKWMCLINFWQALCLL
jgi:hypothetical protein